MIGDLRKVVVVSTGSDWTIQRQKKSWFRLERRIYPTTDNFTLASAALLPLLDECWNSCNLSIRVFQFVNLYIYIYIYIIFFYCIYVYVYIYIYIYIYISFYISIHISLPIIHLHFHGLRNLTGGIKQLKIRTIQASCVSVFPYLSRQLAIIDIAAVGDSATHHMRIRKYKQHSAPNWYTSVIDKNVFKSFSELKKNTKDHLTAYACTLIFYQTIKSLERSHWYHVTQYYLPHGQVISNSTDSPTKFT